MRYKEQMEKERECLEFMETEEFKAIDILQSIRDDSSVRFLDETLYEAIKELKTFVEDYRVVKKQNDYYEECNQLTEIKIQQEEDKDEYNKIIMEGLR